MNTLHAVAYVSSAHHLMDDAELEYLLLASREQNRRSEITGVLLYHDGSFFQYFEGPSPAVTATYARIRASRRHHGLIELLHRPVHAREFQQWDMGFAHSPSRFILRLAQSSWLDTLGAGDPRTADADGLALLRQFWRNATRPR